MLRARNKGKSNDKNEELNRRAADLESCISYEFGRMILTHKSDLYTLCPLQGRFLSNGNGAAILLRDDQGAPGAWITRKAANSNGSDELSAGGLTGNILAVISGFAFASLIIAMRW